MTDELRFQLKIHVDGVDEHHPSTELATRELLDDLNDTPEVVVETRSEAFEGTKGVVDTLLMTATPLAIPAVVRLFRLWLTRDKDRSVNVTITNADKPPTTVEVTGENISLQTLEKAIAEGFKTAQREAKK